MADVCKAHGLVAAADGKCVVCRRPPWETSDQAQRSGRQQALTTILGLCLIAALARVVQLGLVDSAPEPTARAAVRGTPAAATPLPPEPAAAASERPDAATGESADPATAQSHPAEPAPANDTPAQEQANAPKRPRPDPEALSEARKQVRVVMYASPWCYICDRARDQLLAHDVKLVEHDIDADPVAARRLAKRNPSATVPTFEIGGDTLVGYNPWQLQDAVDEVATSLIAKN